MSPEEKLNTLINYYKQLYPHIEFTPESLVRKGGTIRLRDIAYSSDKQAYERLITWCTNKLNNVKSSRIIETIPENQVDLTEEVEALLKGFRPEFGNQQHIQLMGKIGKMRTLKNNLVAAAKKKGQLQKAVDNELKVGKQLHELQVQIINFLKPHHENSN